MSDARKGPPAGDYDVGFGRPPKSGQFKPGQSGNPQGGKKRETTISGALKAELAATQKVCENGKIKTLTKAQIIAKQVIRLASEGKPAAIAQIARLEPKLFAQAIAGSVVADAEVAEDAELTETHLVMMKWLVEGMSSANRDEGAAASEPEQSGDTDE
jgi:hypothetical protein